LDTFGRHTIYTDVSVISKDNVISVLQKAKDAHLQNQTESKFLYNYYRGRQPILTREKTVRPDIQNKIVVNRAAEIADFKCAYLIGEPVQYVGRSSQKKLAKNILKLNNYMLCEDKANKDSELAMWFTNCGHAYRMVLPKKNRLEGDAPFSIFTLDPMSNFIVYHSGLGNEPVMSVKFIDRADGTRVYSIYTRDTYYEVNGDDIKSTPHSLGYIPVIEYRNNLAKLGAFEIVLPLLDAINNVESNRMDSIEQFVQAFLKFVNVNIDKDGLELLRSYGAIKFKSDPSAPADVDYLTQELNQTQTQTLIDNLYDEILTIVGMPSQSNGQQSDSSNNGAVIMRNGWQSAEARAKQTELMFKESERKFLKIVLKICSDIDDLDLKIYDIEQKFTRRNYADLLTKSQVLTTMLQNPKIHPSLAFSHCGMFVDSEAAYCMSMDYYEANKEVVQNDGNGNVVSGQDKNKAGNG
jgi:SPP1 family phage portal protein